MDLSQILGMFGGPQMGATQPQMGQAPQIGASQFFDPMALAQLQADQQKLQRNQALANAFMQQGGQFIPNSGKAGIAAGLASLIRGRMLQSGNDEKVTDILKRTFEAQSQAAQAKRAQDLADEQRKLQEDIFKATQIARSEGAAKKEFALPEFKDGGVFDPTKGTYSPSQDWTNQQLSLKRAEAQIAAANRAPSELDRKLALAQRMGATPDQLKAMVLGGIGPAAPSGYRVNAAGNLEAIPGGPADPATQATKLQPVSAENRTKLGLLDAAQSALDNYKAQGVDQKTGAPTPFANAWTPGNTANTSAEEAIANILRVESGAAISQGEISAAKDRYMPSSLRSDAENKNRLEMLQKKIEAQRNAILQGSTEAGAPAVSGGAKQPTQTAVNPQTGQRIGLIDGQWVPI